MRDRIKMKDRSDIIGVRLSDKNNYKICEYINCELNELFNLFIGLKYFPNRYSFMDMH